MENMAHSSLSPWQSKIPARMTENWSILPHHPEVFFSMLPQVFLLFHEAAKQQSLSPDSSRFSGWWEGMGEEHCESSTQFLGALNSTGMGFLPSQLICSVSRSFRKLRKSSSLRGVHEMWWLWEITAARGLPHVLLCRFHQLCLPMAHRFCNCPGVWAEEWGQEGKACFRKRHTAC